MAITFRNRLVTVAFALLALAATAGVVATVTVATVTAVPRPHPPPEAWDHAAAGDHAAATTGRQVLAVTRYWTRARMARARPLGAPPGTPPSGSPGLPWQRGGVVARATGKAFFTLDGTDYVCSGSTVDSANSDVVVTAAHCVTDGDGSWAENWTFVPGYADGSQPYGSYTARRFFVAPGWHGGGDEGHDVAFAVLNTASLGGRQVHAAEAAGAQAIAFARLPGEASVFGYPAEPPYGGREIDYCSGPLTPDRRDRGADGADGEAGVRCAMTAGDSGGPWLSGFSPGTGTGTVVAVSTFKYSGDSQTLYGAVLGRAARAAYEEAQRSLPS